MTIEQHRASTGAYACRICSLSWKPGSSGQADYKTTLGSRESTRMGSHLSLLSRLVLMIFISASIIQRSKGVTVDNNTKPTIAIVNDDDATVLNEQGTNCTAKVNTVSKGGQCKVMIMLVLQTELIKVQRFKKIKLENIQLNKLNVIEIIL